MDFSKPGFVIGTFLGVVLSLIAHGIMNAQFIPQSAILTNLVDIFSSLFAFIFTPVLIFRPNSVHTIFKIFLVGIPWGFGLVSLLTWISSNLATIKIPSV